MLSGQVQVAIASFPSQTLGLAYDDLYFEKQHFSCGAGHPLFANDDADIEILSGRFLGYLPEHFAHQFVEQGGMRSLLPELFSYEALFQAIYDPVKARRPVVAAMTRVVLMELRRS